MKFPCNRKLPLWVTLPAIALFCISSPKAAAATMTVPAVKDTIESELAQPDSADTSETGSGLTEQKTPPPSEEGFSNTEQAVQESADSAAMHEISAQGDAKDKKNDIPSAEIETHDTALLEELVLDDPFYDVFGSIQDEPEVEGIATLLEPIDPNEAYFETPIEELLAERDLSVQPQDSVQDLKLSPAEHVPAETNLTEAVPSDPGDRATAQTHVQDSMPSAAAYKAASSNAVSTSLVQDKNKEAHTADKNGSSRAAEPDTRTKAAAPSAQEKNVSTERKSRERQTERAVILAQSSHDSNQATESPQDTNTGSGGSTAVSATEPAAPQKAEDSPAKAEAPVEGEDGTHSTASIELDGSEYESPPRAEPIGIVPSRTVAMKKNQYLDILYPGNGWIYIGETDGKNLMRYFKRTLDTDTTTFTLRSREAGNTVLHFYKNDILTGSYIDDYLAVTVENTIARSSNHAVAPSYAEAVPPRPEKTARETADEDLLAASTPAGVHSATEAQKRASAVPPEPKEEPDAEQTGMNAPDGSARESEGGQTVIKNEESSSDIALASDQNENARASTQGDEGTATHITDIDSEGDQSSDALLGLAQKSYDEGKYEDALRHLDDFFAKAAARLDEGLFLQGQVLEANSPVRNIKKALDTYEQLVKQYPQSIRWEKAQERITYLKRFYFTIR